MAKTSLQAVAIARSCTGMSSVTLPQLWQCHVEQVRQLSYGENTEKLWCNSEVKVRRCPNRACERFAQPYRPEQESRWALPQQEFGLDVIAWVGALRYGQHLRVPQIHEILQSARSEHCPTQRGTFALSVMMNSLRST